MDIRVRFQSAALAARCGAEPRRRTAEPDIMLDVHAVGRTPFAARRRHGTSILLDGAGQYQGRLDLNSGIGEAYLSARSPEPALANCLRQIVAALAARTGGIIVHCAAVVRTGRAFLFVGKSGAGKTTVCGLSKGCAVLDDDLVVLKRVGDSVLAWGMPRFRSRPRPALTALGPVPVAAAFLLRQARRAKLRRLRPASAAAGMLGLLAASACRPAQPASLLGILDSIVHAIPCYELEFARNPSFWNVIRAEIEAGAIKS